MKYVCVSERENVEVVWNYKQSLSITARPGMQETQKLADDLQCFHDGFGKKVM